LGAILCGNNRFLFATGYGKKKRVGLYWELPGLQFDGMGIPIASKSRGI